MIEGACHCYLDRRVKAKDISNAPPEFNDESTIRATLADKPTNSDCASFSQSKGQGQGKIQWLKATCNLNVSTRDERGDKGQGHSRQQQHQQQPYREAGCRQSCLCPHPPSSKLTSSFGRHTTEQLNISTRYQPSGADDIPPIRSKSAGRALFFFIPPVAEVEDTSGGDTVMSVETSPLSTSQPEPDDLADLSDDQEPIVHAKRPDSYAPSPARTKSPDSTNSEVAVVPLDITATPSACAAPNAPPPTDAKDWRPMLKGVETGPKRKARLGKKDKHKSCCVVM